MATDTLVATAIPMATDSPLTTPASGGLPTPAQAGSVPAFDHVILIVFENHDYPAVIGNDKLPNFNQLAQQNVLFTQYYAVAHPSLPNYLALTSGSTQGIASDCMACFISAPNIADRLEAGGKTWKAYAEDMPSPCYVGNTQQYDLNHVPFLYYDDIRTNPARCSSHVVPLSQLSTDLQNNQLPNFVFITPNLCHSAHNCALSAADAWLGPLVDQLRSSPALGQNYAIWIVFDESSSENSGCCGLPKGAGGRVPAILISPLAKSGFTDSTPQDHYSLLKTILQAWNLPGLAHTQDAATPLVTAPWK